MRALISVYDKTGIVSFAKSLTEMGWEIVSSGGTSLTLKDAGINCTEVEDATGAPEMLDGRVKTLHPRIHGAILADLDKPDHRESIESFGIKPFSLVVCNLYPFQSQPSIEMIDVGGPSMVRGAAKNHKHVGVVVKPADYEMVIAELKSNNQTLSESTKHQLAREAFAHTAQYDQAILEWFDGQDASSDKAANVDTSQHDQLPEKLTIELSRAQELRYGENPHQVGARYRQEGMSGWWDTVKQHSGMQLSFLNLFDADAAWNLVHALGDKPAAAILKHANPCGVAIASDITEAYDRAFEADPISAFGGIVALNRPVTKELAEDMVTNPKADVLIAPSFSPEAIELFGRKRKNLRVLEAQRPGPRGLELRRIDGGFLVQPADQLKPDDDQWKVVTEAKPDESMIEDLKLAWIVCASVSSNAITIARDCELVGIGAGQQNRLDSSSIAVRKAGDKAKGAVCASDAFFPFRDGLDALAEAGVGAVIQPGGSMRDPEIIDAANEHGISMIFTGKRHFKH